MSSKMYMPLIIRERTKEHPLHITFIDDNPEQISHRGSYAWDRLTHSTDISWWKSLTFTCIAERVPSRTSSQGAYYQKLTTLSSLRLSLSCDDLDASATSEFLRYIGELPSLESLAMYRVPSDLPGYLFPKLRTFSAESWCRHTNEISPVWNMMSKSPFLTSLRIPLTCSPTVFPSSPTITLKYLHTLHVSTYFGSILLKHCTCTILN
uniref:F-box domain-containing protein n=1 Tax=Moniliophthora roreri TaxID=221103 RepID=A0A0W0FDB9_MONRR